MEETKDNTGFKIQGGFNFIATVLDIDFELPLDITPTLRLERASKNQIEVIKKTLVTNYGMSSYSEHYHYESDIKDEGDGRTSYHALPEESFKYYVVSYSGGNQQAYQFFSVADLIFPHLATFSSFPTSEEFRNRKIIGSRRASFGSTSFYFMPTHFPKKFDIDAFNRMQELLQKYIGLDAVLYEGIIRAIRFNDNLKRVSRLNELPVLGLFVIIEMLLTHNPNDKEIGDSLTHQIKTKIAFLSPRFVIPLDYSVFGEKEIPEKIWGSLYEYRSCVAHGNHIDFSKGQLKRLKDADTAYDFLKAATRTLLVQALMEPDIINGLKPI